MKHSKQIDHEYIVEAFKTLFKDQYFHDSCTITTMPGIEDDSLSFEMRTAMGHDGKSLELHFKDASVYPKERNVMGGNGDATVVIEGRAAYFIGAAMIGFALAADDRGEL
jgi:hypothetical protein